ncbi:hypothetical protein [Pigmentiphaga litoralis]|uniref:hypothetical protein n=1 Tax=Pigmentiphaga litoralis TaxID=516702 RepID=UPI003B435FDE
MPAATRAAVRRLATGLRVPEQARAMPAVALATAAQPVSQAMSQTPGGMRDRDAAAVQGASPSATPRAPVPAYAAPASPMNSANAVTAPPTDRSLPPEAPMQSLLDRFSSP